MFTQGLQKKLPIDNMCLQNLCLLLFHIYSVLIATLQKHVFNCSSCCSSPNSLDEEVGRVQALDHCQPKETQWTRGQPRCCKKKEKEKKSALPTISYKGYCMRGNGGYSVCVCVSPAVWVFSFCLHSNCVEVKVKKCNNVKQSVTNHEKI